MTTIWVAFVSAFIVALLATRTVIAFARRIGAVDKPDGYRKVHKQETPRLGGLAIYAAFAAPLVALIHFPEWSQVSRELFSRADTMLSLMIGATLALGLGVLDDLFDLRAIWKLLWQVLIASLMYWFGFSIAAISNPFGGRFGLGAFSFPVTVFWFVGCMNAVNLLDGLDGLAAGMTLFVSLTLFLVSLHFRNLIGMLLMGSLSGAALGFLMFNFPPARIFLGDSGSMLLGFLVAALSLVGATRKAEAAVALFIPVVALGLPILDTSLAILRRWYKRLPISAPDRQHIHHALVAMGYSQRRVVMTLYGICLVLGLAALLITMGRNEVVFLVIGSLVVMAFVCARIFSGVRLSDVVEKLARDRAMNEQSAMAKIAVEKALYEMGEANSVDGVWGAVSRALRGLGMDYGKLSLYSGEEAHVESWSWEAEGYSQDEKARQHADGWWGRLGVRRDGEVLGELTVGKSAGTSQPIPEAAALLDRLRTEISRQLERVSGWEHKQGT